MTYVFSNPFQGFAVKLRAWILKYRGEDESVDTLFVVVLAVIAALCMYSIGVETVALVTGLGCIFFLYVVNVQMKDRLLNRVADFMRGYEVWGRAGEECVRYTLHAAALGCVAYVLEGRLNAFNTGTWLIDTGLHSLITLALIFPPFAAAIVAATAHYVRRLPPRTR